MPIKMWINERGAGPVVICDLCGMRIMDARDANYEWDGEVHQEGSILDVAFLHKKCSALRQHLSPRLYDSNELTDLTPLLGNNINQEWDDYTADLARRTKGWW